MARFDRPFLDEVLARTSILDVVGRRVTWDRRKSQPAKGDLWACCPFHKEDSPSFHAVESRGAYHCFGCGAHGNAFDFVMAMDNVAFPEAVERLARDAGLALPERTPEDTQRDDRAGRVHKALAAAADCYAQALAGSDGARARAYLERRGLGPADWARFGLGWAPASRTWLRERLTQAGHALEDLVTAGLLRQPDDGGAPFDFYRGRVTFAVADTRGRPVTFGARTLDPDGQPKYLNGPESPVFSKSRNLYRYDVARAAARDRPLLVAEGYVDVIALEKAGFAAVAPLGTALTEDQLGLLWKAHRRPVLCLDGDKAGLAAAGRALDRALPLVSAARSVAFALLPAGKDPDDLIRAGGPAAMQEVLERALPLEDFLFEREAAREPLETAQARAGLRQRLREAVRLIGDRDLQREVGEAVRVRMDALFGRAPPAGGEGSQPPERPRGGPRGRFAPGEGPPAPASAELKAMNRALMDLIGAAVLRPALLEAGWELLAGLPVADPGLDSLRHCLLDRSAAGEPIDFEALRGHLTANGAGLAGIALQAIRSSPVNPYVRPGQSQSDGTRLWLAALERQTARAALESETAAARGALASGGTAAWEHLMRLKAESRALDTSGPPSAGAGDTGGGSPGGE